MSHRACRPPLPISALLAALALTAACASTQAPPAHPAEPITAVEALETFDAAWTTIHEQHFDQDFNGVDWVALKEELRPRAAEASSRPELREVIQDMLGRLDQSHFVVMPAPPSSVTDLEIPDDVEGGVGVDLRLRDGRLIVSTVFPNTPAEAAGVQGAFQIFILRFFL